VLRAVDVDPLGVGAGEVVHRDVVGAAQGGELNVLDALEVHGDGGDIAGEPHTSAIGGDAYRFGHTVLALDERRCRRPRRARLCSLPRPPVMKALASSITAVVTPLAEPLDGHRRVKAATPSWSAAPATDLMSRPLTTARAANVLLPGSQLLPDRLESPILTAVPTLEFVAVYDGGLAIFVHAAEPPAVIKRLPQLLLANAVMLPYLHWTGAAGARRTHFAQGHVFLLLSTHVNAPLRMLPCGSAFVGRA
jgi:hypothetical protein